MKQQTEIGKIWPEQEEDAFPAPVDFRPHPPFDDRVLQLAMSQGEARSLLASCRQQLPDCALRDEIENWFRRWPL